MNVSAEAMAKVRQFAKPCGEIVAELILEALRPRPAMVVRNGVPLFPAPPGARPGGAGRVITRTRSDGRV